MYNKILAIFIWIACAAYSHAQSIPIEWKRFTSEDYLYDFLRETNENNLTELQFKKQMHETAFVSLAKKVRMQISDYARLDKSAVNGRTNVNYQATTEFSTNVNLTLTDYKFHYDAECKEGAIIVYINKPAACMFYKNEIRQILSCADNAIETAQEYFDKSFKGKAKKELEVVLPGFSDAREALFWLNFYGMDPDELSELQSECNSKDQAVKRMLADLQHGTTIYLECKADLFGHKYKGLEGELKGVISTIDCSIVETPEDADWIITVNVTTREYNKLTIGETTSYFAYADARLCIEKRKTSQRIYENHLSVKGGHTLNFQEAGREAYRNLCKELGKTITENIQE